MTVDLRCATPDDVEEVLTLWRVAAENDDRPADSSTAVRALLEHDPQALLVAVEGDRILGTVIAGWDGWRAHLYRLAVHPDARRRGIATALLDAARTRLHACGATRLDAMVLEGNDDGRLLWRAAGFTPQARWRRWIRPAGCTTER